jgi:hypothetical protein
LNQSGRATTPIKVNQYQPWLMPRSLIVARNALAQVGFALLPIHCARYCAHMQNQLAGNSFVNLAFNSRVNPYLCGIHGSNRAS